MIVNVSITVKKDDNTTLISEQVEVKARKDALLSMPWAHILQEVLALIMQQAQAAG